MRKTRVGGLRGGWRETPQDHRIDVRDMRQLSNAELEQVILNEYLSLRRPQALLADRK